MTDAIEEVARKSKLNEEIIKRICELANQNTYLTLFNTDRNGRGNIQFDMADSEEILNRLKEKAMAVSDYLTAPTDFRATLAMAIPSGDDVAEKIEEVIDPLQEKIRNLAERISLNDKLKALLANIKTMEYKEKEDAEKNVVKVSSDCKALVFNGESFGDMAKLALRFTKEKDFPLEKTAKLYDLIHEDLKKSGFHVNEELTKISSENVNAKSRLFEPLHNYHMNLVKLSGFREMRRNLEKLTETLTRSILKNK